MDDLDSLMFHELYQDDSFELGAILSTMDSNESNNFASGSRKGRAPNLRRDFASAHQQIVADYFCESPVYNHEIFERRFRMSKELFS